MRRTFLLFVQTPGSRRRVSGGGARPPKSGPRNSLGCASTGRRRKTPLAQSRLVLNNSTLENVRLCVSLSLFPSSSLSPLFICAFICAFVCVHECVLCLHLCFCFRHTLCVCVFAFIVVLCVSLFVCFALLCFALLCFAFYCASLANPVCTCLLCTSPLLEPRQRKLRPGLR